jgi:methylated-DNA-protein-cysteine methyltransferase related protein
MDGKTIMTFRDRVYEITKQIPKGKVATYGQIARLAGNPKASRAVGMFIKTNPYAPAVPCHRVVASDGSLKGYSRGEGILTKKNMLTSEGVSFVRDRIDLLRSQWKN